MTISLSPCLISYVLVSPRHFFFCSQGIRIPVFVCFLKDDLAVPVLFFIAEGVILDTRTFDWVSFVHYFFSID